MSLTEDCARARQDELHRQSEQLRLVRLATADSTKAGRRPLRRVACGLRGWFEAGQLGPVSRRGESDRY